MAGLSWASRPRGAAWLPFLALGLVGVYAAGLVYLMTVTDYKVWGAAVFGPLLLIGSIPLLKRAARDEDRRTIPA